MTAAELQAAVRSHIANSLQNFVGRDPASAEDHVRKAAERALLAMVPAGHAMKVEIVREDEEMAIVREIMEEPNDVISMRVTLLLPLDYVHMTVRLGP